MLSEASWFWAYNNRGIEDHKPTGLDVRNRLTQRSQKCWLVGVSVQLHLHRLMQQIIFIKS